MVQILNSYSRLLQTISNCLLGKTRRVFETIEPLLFSRRDQSTIANDRRRRITVISINP